MEVATLMMRRLVEQIDADLVYFHLGDDFRLIVGSESVGDTTADLGYWTEIGWRDIPAEAAYLSRVPFSFSRSDTDPVSEKILAEAPTSVESVLSVPLVSPDGFVLGGLDICQTAPRFWSTADLTGAKALAACLLSWFQWDAGIERMAHSREVAERRNVALRTSATLLLAGRSDDVLVEALSALMDATDADQGFIERNVDIDGKEHTRTVCFAPSDEAGPFGRWTQKAWSEMPRAFAALSAGDPDICIVDELEDPQAYTGSWVASELVVPIFAGGRWEGLVGFADRNPERSWEGDLPLLQIAAAMIGAFWSNRSTDLELMERAARERALAECARILLSDDESALELALVSIVQATAASTCFVEKNVWDPDAGLVSKIVAAVPPNEPMYEYDHWDRRPWSTMPDTYRVLARGEIFTLSRSDLGPVEASTYADSSIGGELNAPIMVRDQWQGLLGIAVPDERQWSEDERGMAQAAAAIIGAYWERQRNVEELREVVRSKDQFLASVSHEVRTPLTAVVGLSEILRTGFDDYPREQLLELVELISEQGFEMTNIIEDLLVAGRLEIDAISIVSEVISIEAEIAMAMRGVNGSEKVVVEHADLAGYADPVRFRQIMRNLVTNALRYGGETVVITIAETEARMAVISVGDNGVGIRSADTERIFNPYERAGDAPSSAGSVGIGLTVSRHLARKMAGDLVYRRRPGWTWFELTIPILPG